MKLSNLKAVKQSIFALVNIKKRMALLIELVLNARLFVTFNQRIANNTLAFNVRIYAVNRSKLFTAHIIKVNI